MITFPIISVMPGLIGSMWGVFLFSMPHAIDYCFTCADEIQGKRNLMTLAGSFVAGIVGCILIVLSKYI